MYIVIKVDRAQSMEVENETIETSEVIYLIKNNQQRLVNLVCRVRRVALLRQSVNKQAATKQKSTQTDRKPHLFRGANFFHISFIVSFSTCCG